MLVKNKSNRRLYLDSGFIEPGGIGNCSDTDYQNHFSILERLDEIADDSEIVDPSEPESRKRGRPPKLVADNE